MGGGGAPLLSFLRSMHAASTMQALVCGGGVVKAGTEQLVAGPAVPPPWPGLASATRPRRGMQQWPQLPILRTLPG